MNTVTGVQQLRSLVREFMRSYRDQSRIRNWWRDPLLVTARIDERFNILPRIASEEHILPQNLLPEAKTLIVFFVPFVKELVEENITGPFPCRNWGLAYEATNELIGQICERIKSILAVQGYMCALTPATHNF
ncbi:MAG TPA: epoxyqueuosine reductase, partial [Desulfobacteraceae bacterium]|nr:epoxyqueuosine reductase [Desulfobacteraceae bacterium]